jgi:hypothetical protein
MASRPAPRRIVGIDFSGARNAGRAIWIADGRRAGEALRLASCIPACELPDSGNGRTAALAALRRHLAGAGDAAVGIDVPFGLPERLIGAADWLAFVRGFAARWPDAAAFRAGCRAATGGRELRRRCDDEARTPFCPYNLRLHRQTWHGIAEVIAPLVLAGHATAPPMQAVLPGRPLLLETCPASFLKLRGDRLYRPYKGKTPDHRRQRRKILGWLVERNYLRAPSDAAARRILDNSGGDALDAVIAAVIALTASADPANLQPRGDCEQADRLEARVYF